MNVKTQICTLANSLLMQASAINNIDTPVTPQEKAYSKWYKTANEYCLKHLMPNFALDRRVVSQLPNGPAFGFEYAYQKPSDCLKVLGIGNAEDKTNDYNVEGDQIQTDLLADDGLEIRFVKNITDVTKYSPEYIILLAWKLAELTCMEITKDKEMLGYLRKTVPIEFLTASALSGQENKPIRINNSKFRQARYGGYPSTESKK